MNYTQTYLDKSSIKVIIYLFLLIDGFFTLTKTLVYTNSMGALDLNFDSWRGSLVCFSK